MQVYSGASLNVVGAVLRVVSTIEPVICSTVFAQAGYMVAMLGQVLTACAQPFLLYAPTTLASVWFGPKERAVATGVSSLGTASELCHCVSGEVDPTPPSGLRCYNSLRVTVLQTKCCKSA